METEFLKATQPTTSQPMLFNLAEPAEFEALKRLYEKGGIKHIIDDYHEQEKEYFSVLNPSLVYQPDFNERFAAHRENLGKKAQDWQRGRWAYFPWSSTVIHILEKEAFQLVRTARNRNLITKEEQEKFQNAVIGIAGLSVGNSVALAIVLQGGGDHLKLADHDRLALSNMNRIRTSIENLGLSKTEMTARQIYAINPYAEIELFSEGLSRENIEKFFAGPPALDIVVDEIDNLAVKFLIREQAKKRRLAVVMGADNGDNAVIDIERYDEDPETEFFHGRMGEVTYEELARLDKFGIGKKIAQHIGVENVTERMLQSFLEMSKTIVSWPQLGGAALLNGSLIAYCVRRIIAKQPLERNRALVSLDEKLIPAYNNLEEIKKRRQAAEAFRGMLKL